MHDALFQKYSYASIRIFVETVDNPNSVNTLILLADDSEQWRAMERSILETLESLRLIVMEAHDGPEAVQKCARLHPDIVLLDIAMSSLNGIEAAKRIRQGSPNSRIIFVTADNDPDVRKAALAAGAVGYVPKMNAVRELPYAVEAALQSGYPVRFRQPVVYSPFDPN